MRNLIDWLGINIGYTTLLLIVMIASSLLLASSVYIIIHSLVTWHSSLGCIIIYAVTALFLYLYVQILKHIK